MTGNVGDLTLDLKIGGDVKALDAAIAKVKILDTAVTNLNKNLKNTDAGLGFKIGGGSASGSRVASGQKTPREKTEIQIKRAELAQARVDIGFKRVKSQQMDLDLKVIKRERTEKERIEKLNKKEEKEEIKRRKDAEKDAKKFFNTIQGGFEKVAKFGLGAITGGVGIAAAAIGAGSFATSVSNVGSQYGINSQDAQKWKNILRIANPALSDESALGAIAGIQAKLGEQAITGQHTGALLQLGLDPAERSSIRVLEALREKSGGMAPDIRTALQSEFGISPEVGVGLNKQAFSEEDFYKASITPTLTTEQVDANKRFAAAVTKFEIATSTFVGKVLAKAAPAAEQIYENTLGANPNRAIQKDAINKAVNAGILAGTTVGFINPLLGGIAGIGTAAYVGATALARTPEEKARDDAKFRRKFISGRPIKSQHFNPATGEPMSPEDSKLFHESDIAYAKEQHSRLKNSAEFKDIIAGQYSNDNLGGAASVTNNFNTEFNVGNMNSDTVPLVGQTIERSADRITDSIRNKVNSY